jgi:nicotinamide riboside kinase
VPYAVQEQRRCDLTLLTALDLPWVADGLQRDGPQVRQPVDERLRRLLAAHRLPWSLVAGQGEQRFDSALQAVAPLLQRPGATGLALHCPTSPLPFTP